MDHHIQLASPDDYLRIMVIWESAVKATHDFLTKEDFEYFKTAIPEHYLPQREVYLIFSQQLAVGFASASGGNLKMLFIDDAVRGKGYGKALYCFMKDKTGLTRVDVNEQNLQAIVFMKNSDSGKREGRKKTVPAGTIRSSI